MFTEDRPPFYFFLSRRFFPSTHPHLSLSSFKLDFPTGIFKDFVHGRKRKGRRSVKSNSANIREYLPWKKTFVLRNLSLERQHSFSIIGPEFIEKVGRNQEGKKLRPRFSLNRLVNVRNVYSPFSLFTPSYSLFLRGEFRICIPYDIPYIYCRVMLSRFRYAIQAKGEEGIAEIKKSFLKGYSELFG